jgi:hypothetical protein
METAVARARRTLLLAGLQGAGRGKLQARTGKSNSSFSYADLASCEVLLRLEALRAFSSACISACQRRQYDWKVELKGTVNQEVVWYLYEISCKLLFDGNLPLRRRYVSRLSYWLQTIFVMHFFQQEVQKSEVFQQEVQKFPLIARSC